MPSNRAKPSLKQHGAAEQRFLHLISALPKVSVQGYDKFRQVIYWNESSTDIYGYTEKEALGQKLEDLIIPEAMREGVKVLHQRWLDNGEPIPSEELVLRRKDGTDVHVFSSHVMLNEGTDNPEMFCVDIDLSEQYASRQALERIASTDLLTGLPNRRHLQHFLKENIIKASASSSSFALFFIDLDMFKEINDTLGHTWGDELLLRVTERLQHSIGKKGLITRFGGDEFVFVSNVIEDKNEVYGLVNQMHQCFSNSFELGIENVRITSSIGVSIFPHNGVKAEDLLKHADAAMYLAKSNGRNRYHFFTATLGEKLYKERNIASALHESLDKNEFKLVYQPQLDLKTGKAIACEALLRWQPNDKAKAVAPDIFIPIAEKSDLIIKIGRWVFESACAQAKVWKERGINLRVDVNVSGREFEHAGYFQFLSQCRERYQLAPTDIGIELTENVLMHSDNHLIAQLQILRNMGVEISIDDFGTGYSSLSYLKKFPVSHLKIDRSFLDGATENEYDSALMEAIVTVGHKLNLKIVIEGVETIKQSNYCKQLNIEFGQGYLYAKPLTAAGVEEYIETLKHVS